MKCTSFVVVAWLFVANALSAQTASTHPLYPLNLGDRWTYRHVDSKAARDKIKRVVVEVERQEIYVQKDQKDGKAKTTEHIGFILKSTSGDKTTRDHVVLLADGGAHKVTVSGTAVTPPLRFLKLPLAANEKWDVNSVCGNEVIKGTYSWRRDNVKVPAGTYTDAVVVLFSNNKKEPFDRVEVETWYADKVGMVKQRILQKGHEHMLELEKYQAK